MEVRKGSHVIWHDPYGRPHDALVTNVWGPVDSKPSINVVIVNMDEDQTDTYGQKIARETSVVHKDNQSAHGRFWTFKE
jgi:hypothetical protein